MYLDPPFNSNQDYNVLFAERDGSRSAAQIRAFTDTWRWDAGARRVFDETLEKGGKAAEALAAFRSLVGESDMLAYLSMMAPRLVELRRVLKPTGSIYLHCDPTASHYLKVLMDSAFGPENFLSEIVWKRTFAHGTTRSLGRVHDVILAYAKTGDSTWNPQRMGYSEEYKQNWFKFEDADGRRYRLTILSGPGITHGESGLPWRGVDPTKSGRHWAVPGYMRRAMRPPPATVQEALDRLDEMGRIVWPRKANGVPSFKQYIDDMGPTFRRVRMSNP